MTAKTAASQTIDQRMVKALGHPLRHQLLAVLSERVASPSELAQELDEPLGNVSYHIRTLLNLKCIELVRTEPRRGALEHYYRALVRPFFSDKDWTKLPKPTRQSISDQVLGLVWKDAAAAMKSGTFDSRTDRHLSRTILNLDDQGFEDLTEVLANALEEAMRIQAESAGRMQGDGADAIPARLVMMHFETPAGAE